MKTLMIPDIGGTWPTPLLRTELTYPMPHYWRPDEHTEISDFGSSTSYSLVSRVQAYGNNNKQLLQILAL